MAMTESKKYSTIGILSFVFCFVAFMDGILFIESRPTPGAGRHSPLLPADIGI